MRTHARTPTPTYPAPLGILGPAPLKNSRIINEEFQAKKVTQKSNLKYTITHEHTHFLWPRPPKEKEAPPPIIFCLFPSMLESK